MRLNKWPHVRTSDPVLFCLIESSITHPSQRGALDVCNWGPWSTDYSLVPFYVSLSFFSNTCYLLPNIIQFYYNVFSIWILFSRCHIHLLLQWIYIQHFISSLFADSYLHNTDNSSCMEAFSSSSNIFFLTLSLIFLFKIIETSVSCQLAEF